MRIPPLSYRIHQVPSKIRSGSPMLLYQFIIYLFTKISIPKNHTGKEVKTAGLGGPSKISVFHFLLVL